MRLLLIILCILFSFSSFAQITNGGFEVNMAGWTTVAGNVTRSTQVTVGNWTIVPSGAGMARIEPNGANNAAAVQTTLGLTGNQLSSVPSITNVGAMYQDITLTSGQSFTVYWNYVSQDYAPYDDGTFMSVTGPSTQQLTMLARTQSNAQVPAVQSYGSTGWKSITYTATASGTFRLGFGSFNWGDGGVHPILFLDNAMGGTVAPGMAVVTATTAASNITGNSATTGGTITGDGGSAITQRGVVYNTSATPTTANGKVTSAGTTGTFSVELTGLNAGTTYYVRAYAINSAGTVYGPEITFTTTQNSVTLTGTVSKPAGVTPSLSLYKVVSNVETLIETKNTNADGTYSFNVDLNSTYKLYPTLTVQGITSTDFDLVWGEAQNINTPNNTAAGLIMTGTKQWKAADVNENGVLDLGDAYLIAAHNSGYRLINKILWFTSTNYDLITTSNFATINPVTSFTINVVTSNVTQNIKYCILGDVNLSHSSN
jgi:hypothetical protein